MSQTQSSQFSLGERARVPLRWLFRTIWTVGAGLFAWELAAPVWDVRTLGFSELLAALSSFLFPYLSPSAGPTSLHETVELVLGIGLWLFPVCTALFGVTTVISTLWYLSGRWKQRSIEPETGGEA